MAHHMATLTVNGRPFLIDLVVFDKDGTLIDFHHLWAQRARKSVAAVVQHVRGDASLARALYRSLGFDPELGRAIADGPLATAAMDKLYAIAAAVLYQHKLGWRQAEEAVQVSFVPVIDALPTAGDIRPLGDIAAHFRRLRQAGVHLAVATSDNRAATEATLALLGAADLVGALVCGDDGIRGIDAPKKPAPEVLWHVAGQFGVPPGRTMIVSDTASDMIMGARAGAGGRIGVLGGAGDPEALAAHADEVVGSIAEILAA